MREEHIIDMTENDVHRFWAKVDKTEGCWNWTAARVDGYGVFSMKRLRRNYRAHRVAYTLLVGLIPAGLTLDHRCKNRACCNPAHLAPATRGENTLLGDSPAAVAARRDTCLYGHPYDETNTRWVRNRDGVCRQCRTCDRERARERRRQS